MLGRADYGEADGDHHPGRPITALRVALGAGMHADAPGPADLEPYGSDDQLPTAAARALEARAPELAERARRLGLT